MNLLRVFVAAVCLCPSLHSIAYAQDAKAEEKKDIPQEFTLFEKLLSNSVLRGHFTIDGTDLTDLKEELYEIKSVKKLSEGDYWQFTARIKYGKYDLTLPMPLEVKWSDKTPVITLDKVTLPALGTFSARVLFSGNRYAGTWQHGDVGGHLFGIVEKQKEKPVESDDAAAASSNEKS